MTLHLPVLQPEIERTRDQRRSRRHRDVRAKSISVKRMTKRETELGRLLYPDDGHELPATRGDCRDGPRPCPMVSCAHHLYLDVSEIGTMKLNFPDLEVWEMSETCALDVADRGGATLERVAELMNFTRERTRQIEVALFRKLAEAFPELEHLVWEEARGFFQRATLTDEQIPQRALRPPRGGSAR